MQKQEKVISAEAYDANRKNSFKSYLAGEPEYYFHQARRRRLISHPNSIRASTNQSQGRGSILLPSRAAVLPRLDADSGGVKTTSSCVIQNLQTSCSSWYMMYETKRHNVICSLLSGATFAVR